MEIAIGVFALLLGAIALFFQIKEYQKNNKIPQFKGRIGIDENDGIETGKLFEFVTKNEGKIIYLDIYLDNDENRRINNIDKFCFSYYYDSKQKLNGGIEYLINLKSGDDFFYDNRQSSRKLNGYFKIIGFSGPQMGWFSVIMKPVQIEDI